MCSGNLTRPNCALNRMLLICNLANCFSLMPCISFSSLATCRPNISSASISSAVPLPDALPAEFVADLVECLSRLAGRIFGRLTRELLECFRGTNMDESVDDSDASCPGGDADMPLSIFESSSASERSACMTNIENAGTINDHCPENSQSECIDLLLNGATIYSPQIQISKNLLNTNVLWICNWCTSFQDPQSAGSSGSESIICCPQ